MMSQDGKKKLQISPIDARDPEIGRWLGAMEDCRQRTKRVIEGLGPFELDWIYEDHSIGTLLYHICAIELDWLYTDVLEGEQFPAEIAALFPYDVRDKGGKLTRVIGEGLETHLKRMKKTRERLLETYQAMTLQEYRRFRELDGYEVTPQWVLHHLMQHEAEHRTQIEMLREKADTVAD